MLVCGEGWEYITVSYTQSVSASQTVWCPNLQGKTLLPFPGFYKWSGTFANSCITSYRSAIITSLRRCAKDNPRWKFINWRLIRRNRTPQGWIFGTGLQWILFWEKILSYHRGWNSWLRGFRLWSYHNFVTLPALKLQGTGNLEIIAVQGSEGW